MVLLYVGRATRRRRGGKRDPCFLSGTHSRNGRAYRHFSIRARTVPPPLLTADRCHFSVHRLTRPTNTRNNTVSPLPRRSRKILADRSIGRAGGRVGDRPSVM